VYLGLNRCGALAALAIAVGLCGCSSVGLDSDQPWFRKPIDVFGANSGYKFSDLQEARRDRVMTANDLIEANGSCPPPVVAAAPASSNQVASPAGSPMASPDAAAALGDTIALGMSECEIVYRAGQPSNIDLGKNPNGDRTAVLTYQSGPRPGIYRFERGRLMEMDRVAEPAAPQTAKKKPANTKKPAKSNSAA